MKKSVVIGLLGSTLDNTGKGSKRWERWRPTVSLCQHEDFLIDRLELLYQREFKGLMERTCQDIRAVSPETEIVVHEIVMNNPWDFEEVFGVLHDFAGTYSFSRDEEYLVHISTGTHVAQICLFLLTEANYFPAKFIQSGPGRGRTASSSGTYSIIDLDLSKYDQISSRFQEEYQDDISLLKSGIETRNRSFNQLIEQIERVAAHSVDPILLAGPTGAGKSRLALQIYELKYYRNRVEGRFVEVNCATLRGEHAMASLFGHTRGAFTGAVEERAGLLKSSDGGVLFLDEVGELGQDEQAMLLRAIEEGRFLPVGSDIEVESDFQLICGSNKNLAAECRKGNFRNDLLARIDLWTFEMPSLRNRPEDIEPNFDYELEKFCNRTGRRVTINKEARKRFLEFSISPEAKWSANFRDLGGAVTRMATLSSNGRITEDEVVAEIEVLQLKWREAQPMTNGDELILGVLASEEVEKLDLFDKLCLAEVIRECRWHKSLAEAGRHLFHISREKKSKANDSDRLRKYLKKYGLDWSSLANH